MRIKILKKIEIQNVVSWTRLKTITKGFRDGKRQKKSK